jgi:hypothetical protein
VHTGLSTNEPPKVTGHTAHTPDEGADALAAYTTEQLEFLIHFLRGNAAHQEEQMQRLDALKAREARKAHSRSQAPGADLATPGDDQT